MVSNQTPQCKIDEVQSKIVGKKKVLVRSEFIYIDSLSNANEFIIGLKSLKFLLRNSRRC